MATRVWSSLILAGFIGLAPLDSFAEDDDFDFDLDEDEEEDEEPPPERLDEADAEDVDEGDPDESAIPVQPEAAKEDTLEKGSGLLNPDEDDDEEDDSAPLGQLAPPVRVRAEVEYLLAELRHMLSTSASRHPL